MLRHNRIGALRPLREHEEQVMVRELWIGVATRAPPPVVGLSSQYSLGLFGCRKDGSGLLDLVASHEAVPEPAPADDHEALPVADLEGCRLTIPRRPG
jgi:hypothetical protein